MLRCKGQAKSVVLEQIKIKSQGINARLFTGETRQSGTGGKGRVYIHMEEVDDWTQVTYIREERQSHTPEGEDFTVHREKRYKRISN